MNPYLADILAQPRALEGVADRWSAGGPSAEAEGALRRLAPPGVLLTGMGASLFAAYVGSLFLQDGGVPAWAVDASELLASGLGAIPANGVVVLVSQSGESLEVRELVPRLYGKQYVVAVTNEPESPLGRQCDLCIPTGVSRDHSIAVKTYTATIAVLLLTFSAVRGNRSTMVQGVRRTAVMAAEFLGQVRERIAPVLSFLGEPPGVELLGHGTALASAWEGSLLFKEGAKLQAEAMSGGQFRHGAIEVVEPGHTSIVFAPQGRRYEQTVKLIGELLRAGGKVVAVTDGQLRAEDRLLVLPRPSTDEFMAPLLEILPIQILVYELARRRGVEPGTFRNTTPIVTA